MRKCQDFPFGTYYIIFQLCANAHPNWDKWDLLDEVLGTYLEISTLLAFGILAHISHAKASMACSFVRWM